MSSDDLVSEPKAATSAHPYADFLHQVKKPARYAGGEHFARAKSWDELAATMVLAFPDVYDIGMSHQGTKILYSIINKEPDLCLERAFCPWFDMEAELRDRDLPLVSLETYRALNEFDIVGFSLQYELTFSNVLTMLELGGIPLHRRSRRLEDPLVVAGGPVATQPEPMSDFIDVFLIGDAEERLPRLMRHYTQLKNDTSLDRDQILVALAREGGVYCPALYERERCDRSGMMVVSKPRFEGVPAKVSRAFVADINEYPYPDDSPVPVAEAIFDRMAIEIARGCTEGCRFCQAGMIYRPVRERDPEQIVETLVSAIEKGGYDEAAITSLSTADYSCISPLIKQVMQRLRPKKIALGISSLRAYGLDEDLLDDIASVKATGLTFAPEAGTQRMRDVVNKNITEDDIFQTCHRVFSRGWNKVKLYFMIGLPSETDEDVVGIAEMGRQAREIGRQYVKGKVNVIVSVSSHVPKPHTPFQWCAQDSMEELKRKQDILRQESKQRSFKLRTHDFRVSYLEGLIARGDVRTGSLIERAWRLGARFDGWDEHLQWGLWLKAITEWEQELGISHELFLSTLPLDARLAWDHVDVGLEDGFLQMEYKRALKGRFSPPCGKPYQAKVHHTNLEDALEDERKLVCYHCGVACDLTQMRDERIEFLDKMGAAHRLEPRAAETERVSANERVKRGLAPHDFRQGDPIRYRLHYAKSGPMSLRGHLDLIRVIPRILRRAGLPVFYTEGFSPRPQMSFGPPLPLGMTSEAEYVDIALTQSYDVRSVMESLADSSETGLVFLGVRRLVDSEPGVMKRITAVQYEVGLPDGCTVADWREMAERFRARQSTPVDVERKGKRRVVDLSQVLLDVQVLEAEGASGGPARVRLLFAESSGPSIRPVEAIQALFGVDLPAHRFHRTACAQYREADAHASKWGEFSLDDVFEAPSGVSGDVPQDMFRDREAFLRNSPPALGVAQPAPFSV